MILVTIVVTLIIGGILFLSFVTDEFEHDDGITMLKEIEKLIIESKNLPELQDKIRQKSYNPLRGINLDGVSQEINRISDWRIMEHFISKDEKYKDYFLVKIIGDGNCAFNCIATMITGKNGPNSNLVCLLRAAVAINFINNFDDSRVRQICIHDSIHLIPSNGIFFNQDYFYIKTWLTGKNGIVHNKRATFITWTYRILSNILDRPLVLLELESDGTLNELNFFPDYECNRSTKQYSRKPWIVIRYGNQDHVDLLVRSGN